MDLFNENDPRLDQLSREEKDQVRVSYSKHLLQQKIMTTMLFRHKLSLENVKIMKKVNLCKRDCYDKYMEDETASVSSTIASISNCTSSCSKPLEDVTTYDDNIDFLVLTKLEACSESCIQK